MTKGYGSAVGASYDSQRGYLTLVQAVELTTYRGQDEVRLHAQHAEFDRAGHLCVLRAATLEYREGQAEAAQARVLFRDDGSAAHLDATGGFVLTTATGGRLASPTAAMDFDEHNQPRLGHLEGGVILDSKQERAFGAGRPHGAWDVADRGTGFHRPGPVAPRSPGARRDHAERGNQPGGRRADARREPDLALAGGGCGLPDDAGGGKPKARPRWNRRRFTAQAGW